jgi:hypothetical protein
MKMMKIVLVILITVALGTGCLSSAQKEIQTADAKPEGSVPLLKSRMTVDEFIAAIRMGKTLDDLRDRLGIPLLASMRVNYFLSDGSVTQGIGEKSRTLTIRRKGTEQDIIIQQPDRAATP